MISTSTTASANRETTHNAREAGVESSGRDEEGISSCVVEDRD